MLANGEATISCAPDTKIGEQYSVWIGAWNDPDQIVLHGFATCWDAWAFCVCNGMNDPLPNTDGNRRYTLRPPKVKPTQMRMFAHLPAEASDG